MGWKPKSNQATPEEGTTQKWKPPSDQATLVDKNESAATEEEVAPPTPLTKDFGLSQFAKPAEQQAQGPVIEKPEQEKKQQPYAAVVTKNSTISNPPPPKIVPPPKVESPIEKDIQSLNKEAGVSGDDPNLKEFHNEYNVLVTNNSTVSNPKNAPPPLPIKSDVASAAIKQRQKYLENLANPFASMQQASSGILLDDNGEPVNGPETDLLGGDSPGLGNVQLGLKTMNEGANYQDKLSGLYQYAYGLFQNGQFDQVLSSLTTKQGTIPTDANLKWLYHAAEQAKANQVPQAPDIPYFGKGTTVEDFTKRFGAKPEEEEQSKALHENAIEGFQQVTAQKIAEIQQTQDQTKQNELYGEVLSLKNNIAKSKAMLGKNQEALDDVEDILAETPTDPNVLSTKAFLQNRMGDSGGAGITLEKANNERIRQGMIESPMLNEVSPERFRQMQELKGVGQLVDAFEKGNPVAQGMEGISEGQKTILKGLRQMNLGGPITDPASALAGTFKVIEGIGNIGFNTMQFLSPETFLVFQGWNVGLGAADKLTNGMASQILMQPVHTAFSKLGLNDNDLAMSMARALDTVVPIIGIEAGKHMIFGSSDPFLKASKKYLDGKEMSMDEMNDLLSVVHENMTNPGVMADYAKDFIKVSGIPDAMQAQKIGARVAVNEYGSKALNDMRARLGEIMSKGELSFEDMSTARELADRIEKLDARIDDVLDIPMDDELLAKIEEQKGLREKVSKGTEEGTRTKKSEKQRAFGRSTVNALLELSKLRAEYRNYHLSEELWNAKQGKQEFTFGNEEPSTEGATSLYATQPQEVKQVAPKPMLTGDNSDAAIKNYLATVRAAAQQRAGNLRGAFSFDLLRGSDVTYKGKLGTLDKDEEGNYVVRFSDQKAQILPIEDKTNPRESLKELGVKVLPDLTHEDLQTAIRDREQVGETTSKGGNRFFISLANPKKPDAVGDQVMLVKPDGKMKKVEGMTDKDKLGLINKFLKDKGLPERESIVEPKIETNATRKRNRAKGPQPQRGGTDENVSGKGTGPRNPPEKQEAPTSDSERNRVQPGEEKQKVEPEPETPEEKPKYENGAKSRVGSNVTDHAVKKVEGDEADITLADQTERKGKFVVVPLKDVLASHNEQSFAKTEGYPTTAEGRTINDRDYEADKGAQADVISKAPKIKPGILITDNATAEGSPVITKYRTKEGKDVFIVKSGNGRTMITKRAAALHPEEYERYKEELLKKAKRYGLDPEAVKKMMDEEGPVMFAREDETPVDLTTEELKKFNEAPEKAKIPIDEVIGISRTIPEKAKALIAQELSAFETLSEFKASKPASKKVYDMLVDAKAILPHRANEFYNAETREFTEDGIDLVSNIMLSSVLNEEAIRAVNEAGLKGYGSTIASSMFPLTENSNFTTFTLKNGLNDAIALLKELKLSGIDDIVDYLSQSKLGFEKKREFSDDAVMLAFLLDLKPTEFKKAIIRYNDSARSMEQGGGGGIFGNPITPEEALKNIYDYAAREPKGKFPGADKEKEIESILKRGKRIEEYLALRRPPSGGGGEVPAGEGGAKPEPKGEGPEKIDVVKNDEERQQLEDEADDLLDDIDFSKKIEITPSEGEIKLSAKFDFSDTDPFAKKKIKRIEDLPIYEGEAWRVPQGNMGKRGETAGNVIRFEREELGNVGDFTHISKELLSELDKYSHDDLVWVGRSKKDIETYGKTSEGETFTEAEKIELAPNARVLAIDSDGGYLIFSPRKSELKPSNKIGPDNLTDLADKLRAEEEAAKMAAQFVGAKRDHGIIVPDDLDTKGEYRRAPRELLEALEKEGLAEKSKRTIKVFETKNGKRVQTSSYDVEAYNIKFSDIPKVESFKPKAVEEKPIDQKAENFRKFSDAVSKLIQQGHFSLPELAHVLTNKGKATLIPMLKEAYKNVKDNYNLSTNIKNSLHDEAEINNWDPARPFDPGKPKEEIKAGGTGAGSELDFQTGGGSSIGGGGNLRPRPPLQYANSQHIPEDYTEHVVKGKYPLMDEHQRLGVNLALTNFFDRGRRAFLLADGAGVGKTLEEFAIGTEYTNRTGKKTLIITPNSVKEQFPDEAAKFGIDLKKFDIGTYSDLSLGKLKGDYGLIIYDEGHNLKNSYSNKAITAAGLKSDHVMYATATPMDKIPGAEYFLSEISGIPIEQVRSRLGYRMEVVEGPDGKKIPYPVLLEHVDLVDVLQGIIDMRNEAIEKGSMIRRYYPFHGTIEEVEIPMKPLHINDEITLDEYWKEKFAEAAGWRMPPDKKGVILKAWGTKRKFALERLSDQAKVGMAVQLMRKELAEGRRVIVYGLSIKPSEISGAKKMPIEGLSDHRVKGVLEEIAKVLEADGITYSKVYGDNAKLRKAEIDKFNAGTNQVILATPQSGGVGVNLDDQIGNAPRTEILVSPEYGGDAFEQTIGRVSRRNTKSPAKVLILYNKNSIIDNRRRAIINYKLRTLSAMQQGKDPDLQALENYMEDTANYSTEQKKMLTKEPFIETGEDGNAHVFNSFYIQGDLKKLGARWEADRKAWRIPADKVVEAQKIIDDYKGKHDVKGKMQILSSNHIEDELTTLKENKYSLAEGDQIPKEAKRAVQLIDHFQKVFPNVKISMNRVEATSILDDARKKGLLSKKVIEQIMDGSAVKDRELVGKIMRQSGINVITHGFVHKGEVYFFPEHLSENTVIHEMGGHLFNMWAKKEFPEFYRTALKAISTTQYAKDVATDPAYRQINNREDILEEAVARFIGDYGEKLRKNEESYGPLTEWLIKLFRAVKVHMNRVLGKTGQLSVSESKLAKLSIGEWSKIVYDRMLSGQKLTGESSSEIFRPEQKMVINGQQKAVIPYEPEVVDGFYSPIEKQLGEMKFDKLPAKQWADKLGGEEAKWTGVKEWLQSQGDRAVSKEEVNQWLKDNRVKIVEVVKGENDQKWNEDTLDNGNKRWISQDKNYSIVEKKNSEGGNVYMHYERGVYNGTESSLEAAKRNVAGDNTKYSAYQLPGEKSNYKEVLVTMPSKKLPDINITAQKLFGKDYYQLSESEKGQVATKFNIANADFKSPHFDEPNILAHLRMNTRTDADGKKTLFIEEIQSDWGQKGKREGFGGERKQLTQEERDEKREVNDRYDKTQPEYLKLVNLADYIYGTDYTQDQIRELANSTPKQRIGMVEERRQNRLREIENTYGKPESEVAGEKPIETFRKHLVDGAEKRYDNQIKENVNAELDYQQYLSDMNRWMALTNKESEASKPTTPSAPFVTDTNAWTKLALKVALQHAIKEGADRIAWTTGEQQNARYDLSKQLSELRYLKNKNGVKLFAFDTNMNPVTVTPTNHYIPLEKVEEYVGKDMANKIANDEGTDMPYKQDIEGEVYKSLSGEGLKVGGKGMIGFYGSPKEGKLGIVGSVAESLFGKGSVKKSDITGETNRNLSDMEIMNRGRKITSIEEAEKILISGKDTWLYSWGNGESYRLYDHKDIVEAKKGGSLYAVDMKDKSTQHSIDITPELKAEVQIGLPKFSQSSLLAAQIYSGPPAFWQHYGMGQPEYEKIVDDIRDSMVNGKRMKDAINESVSDFYIKNIQSLPAPQRAAWDRKGFKLTLERQFDMEANLERQRLQAMVPKMVEAVEKEFFGTSTEELRKPMAQRWTQQGGTGNIIDKAIGTLAKGEHVLWGGPATYATEAGKKLIGDMLTSKNKILVEVGSIINNMISQASRTKEDYFQSDLMKGETALSVSDALRMQDALKKIINFDKSSLQRINQVLDPQFYRDLGVTPIKESNLGPEELKVFKALDLMNKVIHNTSFMNHMIDYDTYLKFQDRYIGRHYDVYEMPHELENDIAEFTGKFTSRIYKQREAVDLWKGEHNMEDPVYATAKRWYQVMSNAAIQDYTDYIEQNHHNWYLNPVPGKTPPPGYVETGYGYGKMSNKWVLNSVVEDFNGYFYANKMTQLFYDTVKQYDKIALRQIYREGFTVWNLGVQAGNITGNWVLGFLMGVDPITLNKNAIGATKDITGYGPMYRYLLKNNVLNQQLYRGDLKELIDMPMELKDLMKNPNPNVLVKIRDKVRQFYSGVDDAYKIAAFKSLIDQGIPEKEALDSVKNGFQNRNRIAKNWELASRMPLLSPFAKWGSDLQRVIAQAATKRPLMLLGFLGMIRAMSYITGKNESDEEEQIRTSRPGFPKIVLPHALQKLYGGDIPLGFKMGPNTEVNFARLISPYFIYSGIDEGERWRALNRILLPANIDYESNVSNPAGPVAVAMAKLNQDPMLSGLNILFDSNFLGRPIADPSTTWFDRDGSLSNKEKTQNRIEYLLRSYINFGSANYAYISDFMAAVHGDPDYYGRYKTPAQALLSTFYKSQLFQDEQYNKALYQSISPEAIKFKTAADQINQQLNKMYKKERTPEQAMEVVADQLKIQAQLMQQIHTKLDGHEKMLFKSQVGKLYDMMAQSPDQFIMDHKDELQDYQKVYLDPYESEIESWLTILKAAKEGEPEWQKKEIKSSGVQKPEKMPELVH